MIVLIDNYDSFTWNLVQRLGEIDPRLEPGRDLAVLRNDAVTPEQLETIDRGSPPDRIVISPGPCTPREAGVSSAVIHRFAGRVPILGVCLGHQCMADDGGMTVERHRIQVHGKTSPIRHDHAGIFRGLSDPFQATRYHSLIVRPETVPQGPMPDGSRWAVSAWCEDTLPDGCSVRVVMGLRRTFPDPAAPPVEGVQFHPESFLTAEGPRLLANFLGR
ncbi:MAG: aminodeoxychorismate/anthranilate synthase component II [Phycisphaeraceae bacterium]|nr:MAG: aminodeoxychorismate/anthranilate synthase component II [Phycisphaeraceae bacterium]